MENGERSHLNDTVIIKASCSQSKSLKKFIWFKFLKRGIHIYNLTVPRRAMIICKTNDKRGALSSLSMVEQSFGVKLNQQTGEK